MTLFSCPEPSLQVSRSLNRSRTRRPGNRRVRVTPFLFDRLEDRTLLTVIDLSAFAGQLKSQLGTIQTHLTTALDTASHIPFLNGRLGDLKQAQVFTTDLLAKAGDAIAPVTDVTKLQGAIFQALGSPGLNMLGNADGSGPATVSDVHVTPDASDPGFEVEMRIHEVLTDATTPFSLNLGLPAIPFGVKTSGAVHVQVGFDYELAFKFSGATTGVVFSVDTSKLLNDFNGGSPAHELALGVTASLGAAPAFQADVMLGFLEGKVTDHFDTSAPPKGQTAMNVVFTLDGLDPGNLSPKPNLLGSANIDLDLTGGFAANGKAVDGFPSMKTEFKLGWKFDTTKSTDDLLPRVEFLDVSMNLGSFLSQEIGPILKQVQEVTNPLKPLIAVLKAPIPGLSDLSHLIGGGDVNIEGLANLAADSGAAGEYAALIKVVSTIVDVSNDLNHIDLANDNKIWIHFGNFSLGGATDTNAAQRDLRSLAGAADPSGPGFGDLTSLVPGGVSFSSLGDGVDKQLSKFAADNPGVLGDAANAAKGIIAKLDDPNGIKFAFPIFDNPAASGFKLLLGQDADFVTFTAKFKLDAHEDTSFSAFGLGVGFKGDILVDASFKLAYDTHGVREFIQDVSSGDPQRTDAGHLAADFLDGLYIDNSTYTDNATSPPSVQSYTHLSIAGGIKAFLGVGYVVFSVSVSGGVSTGDGGKTPITMTLNDPDNDGKLRASEIATSQCLFETTGELDAGLGVDVKVGLDVPFVGFVGYEHTFVIASAKLIDFSKSPCNPAAPPPPPPVIAGVDPLTGVLTLFMGPNVGMRQNVNSTDPNETFLVTHVNDAGSVVGDETVDVTAFGYTQRVPHVKSIFADGGDGNDTITVGEGVLSDAELHGGVGDDTLTYLGTGHAQLYGDAGNDRLTAGPHSGDSQLTSGDGHDVLIAGGGNDTLRANGGPGDHAEMYAGAGHDTLYGGLGDDQFYAGKGTATMYGNDGNDSFTWSVGDGPVTVDGGSGRNVLEVNGSDASDAITAGADGAGGLRVVADGVTVSASNIYEINLDGGKGADVVTVNDLTGSGVAVVGVNLNTEVGSPDGALDTLNLYGSSRDENVTIGEATGSGTINGNPVSGTVLTVKGLPATVLAANDDDVVRVFPGDGRDTTTIQTRTLAGALILGAGTGGNTVNVLSDSGPTTVIGHSGTNSYNVGFTAPATVFGSVDGIKGPLQFSGSGNDALSVSDALNPIDKIGARAGILTSTALTGLGMGPSGITFSGLKTLGVVLGAGTNELNIQNTAQGTNTTVGGYFGKDFFYVGSAAHNAFFNNSILDTIQGPLTVSGAYPGHDALYADDTGSTAPKTGLVTASAITGLGMGLTGIVYAKLGTLNLGLGTGGDTINVRSTAAGTITTIDPPGVNTFNVGSLAPLTAGGTLAGIAGPLVIIGFGNDTLNVDNSGDATAGQSGTLTGATLVGLGMGPGGITYHGVSTLDIGLGTGGTTLAVNVNALDLPAVTTIDGGPSANDRLPAAFAADFNGLLNLLGFEYATISVAGNFNGTLHDTAPLGTGNIQNIAVVGSLTPLALLTADNIDKMTVGLGLAGRVVVAGALANLGVGGDLSGLVQETLTVQSLTVGGSVTPTGVIQSANASTSTLGNVVNMAVGKDMAGQLIVSGTLTALTVGGGTPGTIKAGKVGTASAAAGFGPLLLQINESGIQRRVEAAVPGSDYPIPPPPPAPTPIVSPAGLTFQFLYEGLANPSLANPQLTARVRNGAPSRDEFDLSLVVWNDTAKFNLARLDAVGVSGLRNVAVEGDLLTAVSPAASSYFGPSPSRAGVSLPKDDLAGVGVRDFAPDGSIAAHSIQAVAFGSHAEEDGTLETGASADADDAGRLLAAGTAIVQAGSTNGTGLETFRVPFADLATQRVAFFLADGPAGGRFDDDTIAFTVQGVNNGITNTPSNVARGAVTALIGVAQAYDKHGRLDDSVVQTIDLRGDGGSIDSRQFVARSITSTGPMGDLAIRSGSGINNVTAPALFGNISTDGPIFGTVQTTGLRTDPITGVQSSVSADLGRAYVVPSAGKHDPAYVTATTIQVGGGGGLTGRIISRGDLVSSIRGDGGISATIAAQGNIGAISMLLGTPTRVGGILSNGPFSGRIVALGNILADMTFHGGLRGARVAARGSRIPGFDPSRVGILGNVVIDGLIDGSSALVSGGEIGDPTLGTTLSAKNNKGVIAAKGVITTDGKGNPNMGSFFSNTASTDPTSSAAIDAIFTDGGKALSFDGPGTLDLTGLDLVLADLAALKVGFNGKLTGTKP